MTEAMQAFVVDVMGQFFVEPPTFDLKGCYEDSSVTMPLIFVLSTGSDPNKVEFIFDTRSGEPSTIHPEITNHSCQCLFPPYFGQKHDYNAVRK